MKYLILFVLFLATVLSGCSDRFRYPCQDPTNWDKSECKPPICTATATCPEDMVKPPNTPQQEPMK